MKKHFPPFVAGMLTMAIVGSVGASALAASGQVSFNLSPIQFNGKTISAAGEDYALDNGQKVPASITYTDEQGGGTTYLPARRIAELMDVDIGYDAAAGSVTINGDTAPEPDSPALPTDYSDWSDEEEAAYQEFKGMWKHNFTGAVERVPLATGGYDDTLWERHDFTFSGGADYTYIELDRVLVQARRDGFIHRLAFEVRTSSSVTDIALFFVDEEHPGAYGEVWHKLWITM